MKKKVFLNFYALALLLVLFSKRLNAQCSGCTTTYASSTGANVTVVSGQTICINPGVTMSGQVFLNGGVICNRGTISNLKLSGGRGVIKNFRTIHDPETAINFGGNVQIYAHDDSDMDIQAPSISASSADSIFICVYHGGIVSFDSDLPFAGKRLGIYNGMTDPGDPTNTDPSYFIVGNDMSVSGSELNVYKA